MFRATGWCAASTQRVDCGKHDDGPPESRAVEPRRLLDWKASGQNASKLIKRFDIRAQGSGDTVRRLSGGNIQKVVLAREFTNDVSFLLIDQPTRGVDIGAQEAIHDEIMRQRADGGAILLISVQLDELEARRPDPGDVQRPDHGRGRRRWCRRGPHRPDDGGRRRERSAETQDAGLASSRVCMVNDSFRAVRPGDRGRLRAALGAVIILLVDESPVHVFTTLLRGAFGDRPGRRHVLQTTPILICGVAACIALRGGMFNVGVEGQLSSAASQPPWWGSPCHARGLHMLAALARRSPPARPGSPYRLFPRALSTPTRWSRRSCRTMWRSCSHPTSRSSFSSARAAGRNAADPASAYLPELFAFSRLNWGLSIGLVLASAHLVLPQHAVAAMPSP